ncbi:hypothetical protein GGI25_006127 [Coemansia spiralis]|uniref:CCDC43 PWI-like domain-containing protein n=2 Tax=Coemansia TaxID=4863 RepID=A0A9W8KVK8_9FUNG|nr:hypothetical protein BX070DRAFT_227123 [Coemansia spiralis]KAJ1986900.1 hypothetical protein EDC05_006109 [Coemansia umbellata]KAJ2618937.1 hypothetical protein GGI26_006222 [Coemansia sp. RSA 1358]KAJ2669480.1 hypothetical protein GGI25_006127 [Coemansia spiralis]
MSKYLEQELNNVGIDDTAIIEYCTGILEDTSADPEEKLEAIVGYLEAVSEADFTTIVKQAIDKASEESAEKKKKMQAVAKAKYGQALEEERQELQRDAQERIDIVKKQLSAEERRQRERLLSAYGGEGMEIVDRPDGEAEIVYKGMEKSREGIVQNSNTQMVLDRERAQRETNKLAHQKKVEKEKELLERDRLKKEKEKQRTMKKEKRRM